MCTLADQDKINAVSHVSTLYNPYTDIRATPTLIHIALSPLVSLFFFLHPQNGAYLHRDFQAHTNTVADSAGLCSKKKSYSRL